MVYYEITIRKVDFESNIKNQVTAKLDQSILDRLKSVGIDGLDVVFKQLKEQLENEQNRSK